MNEKIILYKNKPREIWGYTFGYSGNADSVPDALVKKLFNFEKKIKFIEGVGEIYKASSFDENGQYDESSPDFKNLKAALKSITSTRASKKEFMSSYLEEAQTFYEEVLGRQFNPTTFLQKAMAIAESYSTACRIQAETCFDAMEGYEAFPQRNFGLVGKSETISGENDASITDNDESITDSKDYFKEYHVSLTNSVYYKEVEDQLGEELKKIKANEEREEMSNESNGPKALDSKELGL